MSIPRLRRRVVVGSLIAMGCSSYWFGMFQFGAELSFSPKVLALNVVATVVIVNLAILVHWAVCSIPWVARRIPIEPWGAAIPRWLWWLFVCLLLVYPHWMFLHSRSFAIINMTCAVFGPMVVGILGFWRQRDWRFLAVAALYPVMLYLIWKLV